MTLRAALDALKATPPNTGAVEDILEQTLASGSLSPRHEAAARWAYWALQRGGKFVEPIIAVIEGADPRGSGRFSRKMDNRKARPSANPSGAVA